MSLRQRLFSQSTIIFAVRIGGAGLVFLTQAAIARLWGSAILGEYLVAIAVTNLLAIMLPLGFHTTGSYFAAEYAAKSQGQSLRRFMLHSYGHIVLPGAAILFATGMFLPIFGESVAALAPLWLPVCILAISTAIIYINGAILVGLKRPMAGFFADTIFRPLALVAAFAIVFIARAGAPDLLDLIWWLSSLYFIVALVHFAVVVLTVKPISIDGPAEVGGLKRWWRFAVPWMMISLATDFFFDIDLLFLSSMLSHEQIAIFGICTRIFVLSSFGVSAVYAVAIPGLMADAVNENPQGLLKKIGEANLAAAGVALTLIVLIVIGGPLVLSLFGESFHAGVAPLSILCLAILVRALFGPASMILSARNHPYASLPAIGAGIVILLIGNLILVPHYALVGAATAALIAMLSGSVGLWLTARRVTGLDVSIAPALIERINIWRSTKA